MSRADPTRDREQAPDRRRREPPSYYGGTEGGLGGIPGPLLRNTSRHRMRARQERCPLEDSDDDEWETPVTRRNRTGTQRPTGDIPGGGIGDGPHLRGTLGRDQQQPPPADPANATNAGASSSGGGRDGNPNSQAQGTTDTMSMQTLKYTIERAKTVDLPKIPVEKSEYSAWRLGLRAALLDAGIALRYAKQYLLELNTSDYHDLPYPDDTETVLSALDNKIYAAIFKSLETTGTKTHLRYLKKLDRPASCANLEFGSTSPNRRLS